MEFLQEVLQYKFLIHAVLASVLCGVACGMVGTYVVCRRLVFLSGGITHSSFGGIGIAYYLGLNPLLGAFCFAVLSAIGIEACAADKRIREDSAIGLIWSLGMAVGIIFVYMTPGYAPNLMSFLFGNILSGLRPRICSQPECPYTVDRLSDGRIDRRDDRYLDPCRGNRPADLAVDDAGCDRQSTDPFVRPDDGRSLCRSRCGYTDRSLCKLSARHSFGRRYNICTHRCAYNSKTITFA